MWNTLENVYIDISRNNIFDRKLDRSVSTSNGTCNNCSAQLLGLSSGTLANPIVNQYKKLKVLFYWSLTVASVLFTSLQTHRFTKVLFRYAGFNQEPEITLRSAAFGFKQMKRIPSGRVGTIQTCCNVIYIMICCDAPFMIRYTSQTIRKPCIHMIHR